MNIIIETERTILREFIEDDYKAVFEFGSNLDVIKYTGDKLLDSLDQAKKIITDIWFNDYKNYGYGRWAVLYKPESKVIGFAGLKYLPEFNETDIGFRFLPEYWGKGIASEVSKEIIKYGFKNFGLERIIGIAMPENIASCKVHKKIGLDFYKFDFYDDDDKKCCWYQLKRENYLQQFK